MKESDLALAKLTAHQREDLIEVFRNAFDVVIDLRHWAGLCEDGRAANKPPWVVLAAILEKVYGPRIEPIEDIQDQPLVEIRAVLERLRRQPDKVELIEGRHLRYLEIITASFPEELRNANDQLFFTNLFRKLKKEPAPTLDEEEVDALVRRIRGKQRKRKNNRLL